MALAGLVSYGSSDENESDSENEIEVKPRSSAIAGTSGVETVNNLSNGNPSESRETVASNDVDSRNLDNLIDDSAVDDHVTVGPALPTTLGLPKPKYTEENVDNDVTSGRDNVDKVAGVLSALPKATVTANTLKNSIDDEVEEEFKKLPKNVDLPKPPGKGGKNKTGKIKITLPELPIAGDDSDDDEPKPKKTKIQPCGKSGLIGLLPQPKHVAVKETNRVLVPHTLSKRPNAPVPAKKPITVKPKTGVPKLVDVGSESEDEDENESNFFSFNKKGGAPSSSGVVKPIVPVVNAGPSVQEPALKFQTPGPSSGLGPMAPSAAAASYPSHSLAQSEPTQDYPTPAHPAPDQGHSDGGAAFGHYGNQPGQIDFKTHQKLIQDEQFRRMVGKDFRGEELMDIMDVNAGDQMSNSLELTKSLTEETSNMSYSKKRKDMPSHLSRRKHQITYLAFQAKERELELKNQWSQNKMTKRQTQAKYGF